MPRIPPHTPPRSPFSDSSLAWDMKGHGQRKAPKTDMMIHARRGCPRLLQLLPAHPHPPWASSGDGCTLWQVQSRC